MPTELLRSITRRTTSGSSFRRFQENLEQQVASWRIARASALLAAFDAGISLRYSGYAGWSSLVARRAHNPKVVSSNLTPATKFFLILTARTISLGAVFFVPILENFRSAFL